MRCSRLSTGSSTILSRLTRHDGRCGSHGLAGRGGPYSGQPSPNPVFLLDGEDRFIFLNHAAEMFFDSSEAMLRGTALDAQIPADSQPSGAACPVAQTDGVRRRSGDRGGQPEHRVETSQRSDRTIWRPQHMMRECWSRYGSARWPNVCAASRCFMGRRGRFRQWRRFWRMR